MRALDKRKVCIQRRSLLSNSKRLEKEKAITNCVLPFLKGKIGTYIPIRNEVDVYSHIHNKFDLYIPIFPFKKGKTQFVIAFSFKSLSVFDNELRL